ncbi:MAG: hypothetical protein IT479_11195 [Xanthomonadales bacterium]|nr:hypothetical protein [Xanthomonadales bacterium]MCC6593827.1 hypothetical protein [Xanthomonadales bacterium]MCE7931485.1 hypothetical protein [Xanthomonadales bacterium PRO6]
MGKWVLVLAVVAVAVWWFFLRDPVEVAYGKCLARVEAGAQVDSNADASEIEKSLASAMQGMGQAVGKAGCDAMREVCRENREGAICKAVLAQF